MTRSVFRCPWWFIIGRFQNRSISGGWLELCGCDCLSGGFVGSWFRRRCWRLVWWRRVRGLDGVWIFVTCRWTGRWFGPVFMGCGHWCCVVVACPFVHRLSIVRFEIVRAMSMDDPQPASWTICLAQVVPVRCPCLLSYVFPLPPSLPSPHCAHIGSAITLVGKRHSPKSYCGQPFVATGHIIRVS